MTYPQIVIEDQSRLKTRYKWRNILVPLQQQQQQFGKTEGVDADDEQEESTSSEWIQFLLGVIKGLATKLNLLAEFAAGNSSSIRN